MPGFLAAAGIAQLVYLGCRYKLRAKVTIENVSKDYDVWARFDLSPDSQDCQSELNASPDSLIVSAVPCADP